MSDGLGWITWTVLGWLGVSSLSCGFWVSLSVGALERDPDGVFDTARTHLIAELESTEAAAEWAIRVDRLGAAGLRWLTGVPPDPRGGMREVLDRARSRVHAAWAEAQHARDAIVVAVDSAHTDVEPAGLQALIRHGVRSLTAPALPALGGEARPASNTVARPSERAFIALQRAEAAAEEAHVAIRRLLVRAVVWGVALYGVLAVTSTFALGAMLAYRQTRPIVDPPLSLSLRAAALEDRLPTLTTRAAALAATFEGVEIPRDVARDLAAWLSRAPDTPGSLRGHDRVRGGLIRHSLDVARRVKALVAAAPAHEQRLAITLGAANDLGKLLSYRQDAFGSWTGHPAIPHDSLGAQMLALSPGVRRAFTQHEREDLLLALSCLHAPHLVPATARPRVGELVRVVKRADAEAAAAASEQSAASSAHGATAS